MTKNPVERIDFRLSAAAKADARAALVLLEGSGLSLVDAARRALLGAEERGAAVRRVPAPEAVREFLAEILRRKRRGATLQFYEDNLAPFLLSPLAARWQSVKRPELRKWLEGTFAGDTRRDMVFRAVRALYRWASQQDPRLVAAVPTEGLRIHGAPTGGEDGAKRSVAFYTVEQCAGLLDRASAKARPALALHLFAGIRPMEIAPRFPGKARLAWGNLDLAERHLRVPAEVSKTGRARLLEDLPTPLWDWLALTPESERTGPVWPDTEENWRWHMRRAHEGVAPWLADGFRHTFATMALAHTKDVGRVIEWLGHEGKPRLLRNKYAGLERRAHAERFMALRPPALVAERAALLRVLAARPVVS